MKRYKDTPYYVTNDGRVFRDGIELKPDDWTGYHRVTFSIDGKTKKHAVHRLVAELYIVNEHNKPFVNHINHIRNDNRVENLEWVTHSENMLHCTKHGRGTYDMANEQSVINNLMRNDERFTVLLGNHYKGSERINNRTFIFYECLGCGKSMRSRSDSGIFDNDFVACKKCKNRMKI